MMEHQHLLPTSQPLPYLPLELDHHILRFCDPSTLANTSRVSLAFLELSSPILYQDVEIVGLKNVEKLFCSRKPKLDHPHLHAHLSLSQVRNLTIIATEDIGSVLHLSSSRLPSSTFPLPIDLLTARPIGFGQEDIDSELDAWFIIYQFVDPKAVRIFGLLPSSPRRSFPEFHLGNHVDFLWNNLVELKITDALNGNEDMYIARSLCLDRHPVVIFDLTVDRSSAGHPFFDDALGEIWELELRPGVKEWVFLFGSEREKDRFWELLERSWRRQGNTDAEVEDARQRLRLEVVV